MYETIAVARDARGVATVMLDRAERHNALDAAMIAELTGAAAALGGDPDVRAVVLTGAGRSFCAGGDLGWMKAQMAASADERAAGARALAEMLRRLNEMPKPLIGRLQGQAFGGGIGLACVCDVAVGVEGAKFGLTEVRLGLIPATIGPYVVARMGAARARRVFFSGRVFGADEAVELGVLSKAVPEAELDAAVAAEVAPYLAAAPGAVAAGKRLVRDLGPRIGDAEINASVDALVRQWQGEEAPEGVAAFFEKRPPRWAV